MIINQINGNGREYIKMFSKSKIGTYYFIGMPINKMLTTKIEVLNDIAYLSISDNSGTRFQVVIDDEMKKELLKVCKNGQKKERSKK